MTAREQLAQFAAGSKALPRLCREYKKERATVHLKELVGGALSFYAAAAAAKTGGVHVFVAEDRDAAAYLMNDFYNLLDEKQVYFFPSSYKRSVAYGAEDAQGVVQRTAAMNAVKGFTEGYLIVCTYPEALAERVADAETLRRDTIAVKVGDSISIAVLEDALVDANFTRVDFVYEPGQYSVRGGIVDVFSFSESKPYRIDFFDPPFQHFEPALGRQTRPGGDHSQPQCRRWGGEGVVRAVCGRCCGLLVLRRRLRAASGERYPPQDACRHGTP